MKLNRLRALGGSDRKDHDRCLITMVVDSARIEGVLQMPGETQDAGASVTGEPSNPPWTHIRNI